MSNVSFRIKYYKAELYEQMVPVSTVAVAIMKFLFGMCDCRIDSDVGMGGFLHVMGILHVCGFVHMQLNVSPDIDCYGQDLYKL